ncbi:MAG: hypothetical protein LBG81_07155, partial [Coriobacteriaceae bacterium]|nr:hypothetical protein [Coriobacteriaceae bacterium]
MTSNVTEPGPKGRGIKRLAILGLLVLSLLNGLIGLANQFDGFPAKESTYGLWILYFCYGLFLVAKSRGLAKKGVFALRAPLLMALGLVLIILQPWIQMMGWAGYAKGILGYELIWGLVESCATICYAGSLFLVLAGTFNIIPEKPFIFIVRLVLIALA